MRGGRRQPRARPGTFDPDDQDKVTHKKIGVWDLYEDKPDVLAKMPFLTRLQPYYELRENAPYLLRMLKDIGTNASVVWYLVILVVTSFLKSLLPALSLW